MKKTYVYTFFAETSTRKEAIEFVKNMLCDMEITTYKIVWVRTITPIFTDRYYRIKVEYELSIAPQESAEGKER